MNHKIIAFSSLVSALIGIVVGIGAAEISQNQFESQVYSNLHWKFALAGAGFGSLAGAAPEIVRELKNQQQL